MKIWWNPCSSLKMWCREDQQEEENNKTESGEKKARGILCLNIYIFAFTGLSSGGI